MEKNTSEYFLIAEIGINHNGSLSIAKQLIDAASDAGFDAVKFQKRDLESSYSKDFLVSPRDSPWGTTQYDQKKALEFGYDEYQEISNYCNAKDILWSASPWDIKSVDFLADFHPPFVKIPSARLTDKNLVQYVASKEWFIFLSTGMSSISEIDDAVFILRQQDRKFQLMHCNSTYPMREFDANLRVINTLSDRYGMNIGYSGHESTLLKVCITAASIGSTSFERHITLDRAMYGSDQAASVEIGSLRSFVSTIRKVPHILGDGHKKITDAELLIRQKLSI